MMTKTASLPYTELMKKLKRHKGVFDRKRLKFSVWFWVKYPEYIEKTRKTKIDITPEALEVLDLVEEYAKPEENETVQRLSESFRKKFVFE